MFYFNALIGLLFTFPSRYLFTIDLQEYLALAVSSAGFSRPIHASRYSRRVIEEMRHFHLRDCHPLWSGFPASSINDTFFNSSLNINTQNITPLQPPAQERDLGSSLFARRYLGNKIFFSFPPGTEMFHFPGCAPMQDRRPDYSSGQVSPFGKLRIKGC